MIRIITLNEGWGAGFPLGLLGAIFILAFLWSYWVWQVWTLERSNFLQNLKGVGHWSRQSCTRFHVLRQGNLHCMLNKSLRDRMKDSLGTPHVASSLAVPWRSRPEEGKGQTGTERSQPARLPCLLIFQAQPRLWGCANNMPDPDAQGVVGGIGKGHWLRGQMALGLNSASAPSQGWDMKTGPPLLGLTLHHWTT